MGINYGLWEEYNEPEMLVWSQSGIEDTSKIQGLINSDKNSNLKYFQELDIIN